MPDASLAAALPAGATPPSPPAAPAGAALWSKGGFGFKDLLDIVNPLQHLPVIGSIYRYLTGDEPSGGASIVGDTLYGGPVGLGVGVVGSMLTDSQGRDVGERMLAAVFGPSGGSPTLGTPSVAAVPAAPTTTAAARRAIPIRGGAQRRAASPGRDPIRQTALPLAAACRYARADLPGPECPVPAPGRHWPSPNSKPVPLELTSNLLPISRASAAARPAITPPNGDGSTNPIAQKMRDALDKYDQLKKQQTQEDSAVSPAPSPIDLSL